MSHERDFHVDERGPTRVVVDNSLQLVEQLLLLFSMYGLRI